jgi:hypothetical protein
MELDKDCAQYAIMSCQILCSAIYGRLPREIRDMIHEYVATPDSPWHCWDPDYLGENTEHEVLETWYRAQVFKVKFGYLRDNILPPKSRLTIERLHEFVTNIVFTVDPNRDLWGLFYYVQYRQSRPSTLDICLQNIPMLKNFKAGTRFILNIMDISHWVFPKGAEQHGTYRVVTLQDCSDRDLRTIAGQMSQDFSQGFCELKRLGYRISFAIDSQSKTLLSEDAHSTQETFYTLIHKHQQVSNYHEAMNGIE